MQWLVALCLIRLRRELGRRIFRLDHFLEIGVVFRSSFKSPTHGDSVPVPFHSRSIGFQPHLVYVMQSQWGLVTAQASLPPAQPRPEQSHRFQPKRLMGAFLPAILLCLLAGCTTGRVFTPNNLPAEWHAKVNSNVKTVDLSQLASATVPNDQIASGDVLEISIAAGLAEEGVNSYAARVDGRGDIEIPEVGRLNVGGVKLPEAEAMIKTQLISRQYYRNPSVVITMKQRKEIEVTVVGAVKEEGTFQLRSGSAGVLHALSMAKGLAEDAGTEVEVRLPEGAVLEQGIPESEPAIAGGPGAEHALVEHRVPVRTAGPRNYKIDLTALHDTDSGQMQLADGAVVMVHRRDPQPLQVMGLVRKPDIYDYPINQNMHLLDAIAMAGGESSMVADKVIVTRRRPNQQDPAVIQLSIYKAKRTGIDNILLEPGDTVSVEQTAATVILEAIRTVGFTASGRVF